ncbi:HAMP domain-containing sensor histidine kinase [Actinoplanes sp. NPDC051633]|uniref:sensor histidine kinase n=1 Tax=Actinoplanes sp. NPDC051633 TaxID=3155670 RepID=UPI0034121F28
MPARPDYATLTRGQIAVLDRINAGEAGLPVLHQIVRLAQEVLGGVGAGFAEYDADHGRVIAASGVCANTLGRRVGRDDPGRTLLIPLNAVNDEFARHAEGGGPRRVLGARSEANGTVVGSLHVYFDQDDAEPGSQPSPEGSPEHQAVLELLASYVGRLYGYRAGLPVHGDNRRQEDRDLWVAVTSHELRTPVTVIKGYADTLTNHWSSMSEEGRQEAVRIIGARASELARLVDRLLNATSEDGEVGASPAGPFDLVDALRAAVEELPASLRDRVTAQDLPGDLPKTFGDRDSLATILTELATNADKHSPAGSPIELWASSDEETVTFRLADRGVGIDPAHVEKAFERYWQGDRGDRERHPGAGLGLYLVRRIVERQHGWVSLRPREGGGTVAEVRLPRA